LFDSHMIFTLVSTAIAGGIIGLDRTAVGQFMVSQPIVAGPLMGWVLGDTVTGIVIGASLELIWVLDMPIGSFVPANSTISTVSATAIAVLGNKGHGTLPIIGFSLLLTTCMVPVTMLADSVIRKWNSHLWDIASSGSGKLTGRLLARAHLFGITVFFLKSFVLYLILIPIGIATIEIFLQFPEYIHRAMSFFVKLFPLLGSALIVRKLSIKIFDIFLLAGFVTAALLGPVFHLPIVVLVMTIIGGLLGARYFEEEAR